MRFLTAILLTWIFASTSAFALDVPVDGALGLQPAVTPIMERITEFHLLLLWIIIPITLFVMGLLIWVMVRYNKKANPVPSGPLCRS
jgi:cytochrome c oxidase subunit II